MLILCLSYFFTTAKHFSSARNIELIPSAEYEGRGYVRNFSFIVFTFGLISDPDNHPPAKTQFHIKY